MSADAAPSAGLRALLRDTDGRQLVGTFVTLPRVEVVEMIAHAGFDLAVIDCEHGPIGVESLPWLVACGQGAGLSMVVRVADNRPQTLASALDAGADGVLVPHVGSGADALAVVHAARFPPEGGRSVNPLVRGGRYGSHPTYGSNTAVAVLAMIEGGDAVTNLPDVLAVDDIDAVFVGPMDLSASLGHLGEPDHRDVQTSIGEVFTAAEKARRASATFAATPQQANEYLAQGVRVVVLSADAALLASGLKAARDELPREKTRR